MPGPKHFKQIHEDYEQEPLVPFRRTVIMVVTFSAVMYLACEFISAMIFHYRWNALSRDTGVPYWRLGILWEFLKHMGARKKLEALLVIAYFLPSIVQVTNTAQIRLCSLQRKIRSGLPFKKKSRNIEQLPDELTEQSVVSGFFQYTPLDSLEKEIRLLRLYPGIKDGQIRVDIAYASLHDRPRYFALSYVWGDAAKRKHRIYINGRHFQVTKSLLDTLEHLRNLQGPDAGVPFWIDALCIDQSSDLEKSEQVLLMKEIYAQAYKVLVWLGPPSEMSELALAKMRAVEAHYYLDIYASYGNPRREASKSRLARISFFFREDSEQFFISLEAIISFLEDPWWGRAWIAQEVTSPTSYRTPLGNVEIIMGRQLQTISLRSSVRQLGFILGMAYEAVDSFDDSVQHLVERLKVANEASLSISRLASINKLQEKSMPVGQQVIMALSETLKNKALGPTRETLLWSLKVRPMLNYFRELRCTDPRDKVYAALPLVLPQFHSAFAPDYALSTAEVYIKVVESFIKHERCLSILADRSGEDPEMPSWVPDFRCAVDSYSLCTRLDMHSCPIYRAGGCRLPETRISTEKFFQTTPSSCTKTEPKLHQVIQQQGIPSSVRNVLNVNRVILDKHETLGPIVSNSKAVRRPEWEELLQQLPEHYAPANEPTSHSYQRILSADVEGTLSFVGNEPFATWTQRISTVFERMQSSCRAWLSQVHKYPQSFSVLQQWDDIPGPRTKHTAWARGDDTLEDFFARPEPPEEKDSSLVPDADADIALGRRGKGGGRRSRKTLIHEATKNRVFCVTEMGYMGLVPQQTKEGDQIVVLFGGHTPFVLRERECDIPGLSNAERRWQLIGECYVHAWMARP